MQKIRTIKENNAHHPKALYFVFIAILLVQTASLIFFCFQKQDFHIDEIYSYILSNGSSLPELVFSESIWNNWTDSEQFIDLLSVQPEERFSYGQVYNYNSLDAHPPLFYFLLHTICSFFPNVFSKWLGLGMNIALFILTQFVLFILSKKIFGNTLWAVVPCAILGGTQICFDSFTFIRMYSLLELFTILLLYLHYEMIYRKKQTDFLWCFIVTFLGVFTQYYFAITAFFIAAAFCFFLLSQRSWKSLFLYAFSMLSAVLCVFLVYPAAVSQITGSSTNNVGNAIWGHMLDFSSLFHSCLIMGRLLLIGIGAGLRHCKVLVCFTIIVFLFLSLIFNKKDSSHKEKNSTESMWLLIVGSIIFFLDFLTVTHISNQFIYDRYIYNILPLFALCASLAVKLFVEKFPLNQQLVVIGVIVVWSISCISLVYHNNNNYLFQDTSETNATIIEQCKTKPLIIICSSHYDVHMLAGNYTVLMNCDQMYIEDSYDSEQMVDILSSVNCSNGVVVMIITDKYWTAGLDSEQIMAEYMATFPEFTELQILTKCKFGNVYITK